MKSIGVGLVVALGSLVACGGNSAHFSNQGEDKNESGALPPGAGSAGDAGTGAGGDLVVGSGGAAGAGHVGYGGDAGGPPVDLVVGPTEQGLDPDDVITDPALLDGQSFVLPSGLCPQKSPAPKWSNNEGYSPSEATSLRNLHVERHGDDLELVSSTPTQTSPVIQRIPLEPTSLGFRVTELVVCTATVYDFEDTYEIASYAAPLAHLVFVPGDGSGTTEVVLGAWLDVDGKTVVRTGGPDQDPPAIHSLDVKGERLTAHDGSWDPVTPGGVEPPYHFFFDEPVLDADLSIDGGSGSPIQVTKRVSNGFLVGFSVHSFVTGEPAIDHAVTDLAGNAWGAGAYPGITLPVVSDVESSADYIPFVYGYGVHHTALLTTLTDEDASIGDVSVPPLSGTRSLLLEEAAVYLRAERSPEATQLSFSVRALQSPSTEVAVSIVALENGDESAWTFDQVPETPGDVTAWLADPAYEGDSSAFVSLPEKLSVPLPQTGDDLLVRIEGGVLWLDSLVTE